MYFLQLVELLQKHVEYLLPIPIPNLNYILSYVSLLLFAIRHDIYSPKHISDLGL